jgi:hypothetical protein
MFSTTCAFENSWGRPFEPKLRRLVSGDRQTRIVGANSSGRPTRIAARAARIFARCGKAVMASSALPLVDGTMSAEKLFEGFESGQLARRGCIVFDHSWPLLVNSADGRMAALMYRSSNYLCGHLVHGLIGQDYATVHTAAEVAAKQPGGLVAFRGRDHEAIFVIGWSKEMDALELVGVPLYESCPEPLEVRGELKIFRSATKPYLSLRELCDVTLTRRLGGTGPKVATAVELACESSNHFDDMDLGYKTGMVQKPSENVLCKLDKLSM